MKNKKYSIVLILVLICNMVCGNILVSAANDVAFYVSPDGNDGNSGTIGAPLATLAGARDAVRKYKKSNGLPSGGINVYFRGGKYQITEKTDFEEQDSGTAESPIVYRPYGDEKPVFTGGYYVKGSDFRSVTDESILSRFPSDDAKKNVLQYDLKGNGITDYGTIPASCGSQKDGNPNGFGNKIGQMEAYLDDDYLRLARYPNYNADPDLGWTTIGEVVKSAPAWEWEKGPGIFKYTDTRIENWKSYDDIHIDGFFNWWFFYDDVQIASVNKDTKEISLMDTTYSGLAEGRRYFYYNVLDELDAPGEYYIDRTNGIMYLYPTKSLENSTIKLSSYGEPLMVECKNLSFVTFSGLTFELTRGSVFHVVGGDSVTFSACTMRDIGIRAIWIGDTFAAEGAVDKAEDLAGEMAKTFDNAANGVNHKVVGCEMYNLGYGGVKMKGGDVYRLVSANFSVENSEIHTFGLRSKGYDNGINYGGYGFLIRNNEIHDAPNGAILGQALNTVIEYNNLYDVAREVSDAAAIYTNYCWPIHDMHIKYNYIHDIPASDLGHTFFDGNISMKVGIYTDTDLIGADIYGNVIENVPMGYYNSGKGEKVKNNIFIDCDLAMSPWIDRADLTGWPAEEAVKANISTFRFMNWFPFESELWRNKWPEFYKFYDEWKTHDDASDFCGQIINNLSVYNKKANRYEYNLPENRLKYTDGEEYVYEDNIVTKEDPGFVDMENGNYNLKDTSKIYSMIPTFEKLDTAKMGLLTNVVGTDAYNTVVLSMGSSKALASGQSVSIDSENAAVTPQNIEGRTYVPARFVAENMGASVKWDEDGQKVTINSDQRKIELTVNDANITVDGETTAMDTAAVIEEGRVMVPLRALAETGLKKNVYWNDKGLIVISDSDNTIFASDEAAVDRALTNLSNN